MKKDQYFNLEVNLLNDDNIAGMMLELGAANALGDECRGSTRNLRDLAVASAH